MTEFTPEQLRALADDLHTIDGRVHSLTLDRARTALRAAADEVDRLRAENEHLVGELSAVSANRDHAADGFQRLRAVIENAPHASDCGGSYNLFTFAPGDPPRRYWTGCNCWKAGEL